MKTDDKKSRYEKWQAIINDQEAGGLSQAVFCKERNLSPARLGYYRSILKLKQNISTGSFSPVTIKQTPIVKDIRLMLPEPYRYFVRDVKLHS